MSRNTVSCEAKHFANLGGGGLKFTPRGFCSLSGKPNTVHWHLVDGLGIIADVFQRSRLQELHEGRRGVPSN